MAEKLDASKGLTAKTFHTLYRDVAREDEELQTKAAQYRNACKRLDKAGCDMKALRLALQIQKMEDAAAGRLHGSVPAHRQVAAAWHRPSSRTSSCAWPMSRSLQRTTSSRPPRSSPRWKDTITARPAARCRAARTSQDQPCTLPGRVDATAAMLTQTVDTSKPREKPASRSRKRPTADSIANPDLH